MLASFLRCHTTTEILNLTEGGCDKHEVHGIAKRRMSGEEMLPMLAVGCRAFALKVKEAGCFCEVTGVSIVAVGGPHSQ